MSLLESMFEEVQFINKTKTPDGEGGFIDTWTDGEKFNAAITMDTTMQARIAEKEGVTSKYTITTKRNVNIAFHDVIKRLSDGKMFRATSDSTDSKSPSFGSLDIAQVTAEEWKMNS